MGYIAKNYPHGQRSYDPNNTQDPRKVPLQEQGIDSKTVWQEISRKGKGSSKVTSIKQTEIPIFIRFQGLVNEEVNMESMIQQEALKKDSKKEGEDVIKKKSGMENAHIGEPSTVLPKS